MVDRTPRFFDADDRLAELSGKGDDLERVKALADFEIFRPAHATAVSRADRGKGRRPPVDAADMLFDRTRSLFEGQLRRPQRNRYVFIGQRSHCHGATRTDGSDSDFAIIGVPELPS